MIYDILDWRRGCKA